jgi:hypothetical protein
MLRLGTDKAPGATLTTQTTGGATLQILADRNPANQTAVAAAGLKILIMLPDTLTPVNCVALYGLSTGMLGGTVSIKAMSSAPSGGDWASYVWSKDIAARNCWVPINAMGYDATNYVYYKYWLVFVAPPSGGSGYLGEVSLGLAEAPVHNYSWGRTRQNVCSVMHLLTVGKVEYTYQTNALDRVGHTIQWPGFLDEIAKAQLRALFFASQGELYPVILIPDDLDPADGGTYYSRFSNELQDVERFFNQYDMQLQFIEASAFVNAT